MPSPETQTSPESPTELGSGAEEDPFRPLAPDDARFEANPELLERLLATPHGYYRFINIPFSQAVCERFSSRVRSMPTVNLHGDAHLEQYTVTDVGVGLSDFDDSSFGPGVLDIVRFGGSIYLMSEQRGWSDSFGAALEAFLAGYREALERPERERQPTAFAERTRPGFDADRAEFLVWATELMEELPDPELFEDHYRRYRELMEAEHEELAEGFFEMKRAGRFRMGVGSALDEKYLACIEGPSPAPDDDIILEAKEVRDLSGIDCISGSDAGGAFRILIAQSRIGDMPHRFLAQIPPAPRAPVSARMYWVHEWLANYAELDVEETLESPEELAEIARDVGFQMGRGHVRAIASPLDSQLRRAQLALLEELDEELREVVVELSQRSHVAWRAFVAAAESRGD